MQPQLPFDFGDVALLGGVVAAVLLSRRTIQIIRENLAWAFGYNLLLVPVAAGALYPGVTLVVFTVLVIVVRTAGSTSRSELTPRALRQTRS